MYKRTLADLLVSSRLCQPSNQQYPSLAFHNSHSQAKSLFEPSTTLSYQSCPAAVLAHVVAILVAVLLASASVRYVDMLVESLIERTLD